MKLVLLNIVFYYQYVGLVLLRLNVSLFGLTLQRKQNEPSLTSIKEVGGSGRVSGAGSTDRSTVT